MAFKLPKLNIGGVLSDITSSLNIKAPDIKQELDKRYGLGEFAGLPTEKRRKPGESEYNYRTRMNALERRNRSFNQQQQTTTTTDPNEITIVPETNKDDLREKTVINFGITPDMSFNEAFAQAGRGGAKRGDIFEFGGKKFLYEFKQENEEEKKKNKQEKQEEIIKDNEQNYPLPPPPPANTEENRKIIENQGVELTAEQQIQQIDNKILELEAQKELETTVMGRGKIITKIKELQAEKRRLQ
tara:strand:+ start:241 stop:969 length:729 start_codon:yes stop_codon:yes gene_type:complete